MKEQITRIVMLSVTTALIHAGTPALSALDVHLPAPSTTARLALPGNSVPTGCGLVAALTALETTLEQR